MPRTEAGKRLLDEGWDNFDPEPWGSIADHVDAIEAEAVTAGLDALAANVERMREGRGLNGYVMATDVLAAIEEAKAYREDTDARVP